MPADAGAYRQITCFGDRFYYSGGTVLQNGGSITDLQAGTVGTDAGTIDRIVNTGLLTVNDEKESVHYVQMGCGILRNDGTVLDNGLLVLSAAALAAVRTAGKRKTIGF